MHSVVVLGRDVVHNIETYTQKKGNPMVGTSTRRGPTAIAYLLMMIHGNVVTIYACQKATVTWVGESAKGATAMEPDSETPAAEKKLPSIEKTA